MLQHSSIRLTPYQIDTVPDSFDVFGIKQKTFARAETTYSRCGSGALWPRPPAA